MRIAEEGDVHPLHRGGEGGLDHGLIVEEEIVEMVTGDGVVRRTAAAARRQQETAPWTTARPRDGCRGYDGSIW